MFKGEKITDVRVYIKPVREANWATETVIANPMSVYPEYAPKRSSWFGLREMVLVEIETASGIVGLGETIGGLATAAIIKQHLRQFVINQSPFQVERLWEIMFRATLPYGRKGLAIMAISAVDLALWDCISQCRQEPLYVSLGGPVRDSIQAYATGNDFTLSKKDNYLGQKLAMPYGPADGYKGRQKNLELIRQARETFGDSREIMLDCYMGWNVEYTFEMAELVKPYRVKWIEEALPPDDYEGYAFLNKQIKSTMIATGEHEFTRYGFQQLIKYDAAAILQPDIHWCGGLTEAKKICALAGARHLPVIPHGGGSQPWTQHLLFSQQEIPMAEYFPSEKQEHGFYEGFLRPQNGYFKLPDCVGVGIQIKEVARKTLQKV